MVDHWFVKIELLTKKCWHRLTSESPELYILSYVNIPAIYTIKNIQFTLEKSLLGLFNGKKNNNNIVTIIIYVICY